MLTVTLKTKLTATQGDTFYSGDAQVILPTKGVYCVHWRHTKIRMFEADLRNGTHILLSQDTTMIVFESGIMAQDERAC